jgi:hypothetical protein
LVVRRKLHSSPPFQRQSGEHSIAIQVDRLIVSVTDTDNPFAGIRPAKTNHVKATETIVGSLMTSYEVGPCVSYEQSSP